MHETLRNLGIVAPLDTKTLVLVIHEIGGDVAFGNVPKHVVTRSGSRFCLTIPKEPDGFPGSRAWTNHHLLMGLLDALVRHGYRTDAKRWERGIPITGILNTWDLYCELAMPEGMFREQAGILSLEQMSDYFGVPVTDVEARAVQLGLKQSRYKRY